MSTRAQKQFFFLFGISIIMLSFAYGISVGLKRKSHWAYAKSESWEVPLGDGERMLLLSQLGFPAGVELTRVGKNTLINNQPATIVSFSTNLSFSRILIEQKQFWEASGFKTSSTGGKHRAVLVGFDPVSHRKISLSVWSVPGAIREVVSNGMAVQGMLSVLDVASPQSSLESIAIPDLPVAQGSQGGAVFQSEDLGGTTFSTVYSNPGSLEQNIEFYRRELIASGWQAVSGDVSEGKHRVGHLTFARDGDELMLLLSPGESEDESRLKTVVAVFRGPKLDIHKRVF